MQRTLNKYCFFIFASIVIFVFLRCSGSASCDSCSIKELTQEEKQELQAALGRNFFFDKRFSKDNSTSCSSCHVPEKAFTDGKSLSLGVGERVGFRNAPTLLNVRDASTFMFDAEITSLEQQAIVPIQDHAEMDMRMGDLVEKLNKDVHYVDAAFRLYGRPLDAYVITRALATFERTLISVDSRFDQFYASQDSSVLNANELAGWEVFKKLDCISCHQLPHFTDYKAHTTQMSFYENDLGRFRVSGQSKDVGAFRTPSLRNIELTAPYKHDGSEFDLTRLVSLHRFGNKDGTIAIPKMDYERLQNETELIVSFLGSLTDTSYLTAFP